MMIGRFRVPMLASLVVWAVIWEIFGRSGASLVIPPLSNIFVRVIEIVSTPTFINALWITGRSFLLGNIIAISVGVPLGILMGRSAIADRILLPWVNMFLSAPLTALVPVIMVLFGLGETTIVLTVVLFAIWIIVLDARAGVREFRFRWLKWRGASGPIGGKRSAESTCGRRCLKSCRA